MQKPRLSLWQIWNISFGFLGIQFGWGLQMANMSSIYSYLGVNENDLALLWLAAPTTGLLVQPIVGYFSDRTWNRLGRRRPYFLGGAILSTIALVCMPNSSFWWMAAGLLWILDASVNISMEPFRAFVADLLPEEQHTVGFATQTFLIGIGAVVASALPWILTNGFGIESISTAANTIPANVKLAFYIGSVVLFSAVLYTILTTKEYPPENMNSFREKNKKECASPDVIFKTMLTQFLAMPKTMRQIGLVQFFTWLTFFFMWVYFVPSVATYTFGATSPQDPAYGDGRNWGGVCFSIYNGVAVPAALLLPLLAGWIGKKFTHILCLLAGGSGLVLTFFFIHNQYLLIITMTLVGIAWASTLAMPYAILARTLPPADLGFYMGVFNFFIVLPQIASSLLGSFLMRFVLHSNTLAAVVLGGCSMILAAILMLRVDESE